MELIGGGSVINGATPSSLSFMSELTSTVPQGNMESIYTGLALYGSKTLCARTDNVLFPISEVFNSTVSLIKLDGVSPGDNSPSTN